MSIDTNVSESVARLFWEQCAGQYHGHVAPIPHSPILRSLLESHEALNKNEFIRFLRQVADRLEKEERF